MGSVMYVYIMTGFVDTSDQSMSLLYTVGFEKER